MAFIAGLLAALGRLIEAVWLALLRAAPVRLWALILAAPPLTAYAIWTTHIVWRGPWPADRAQQQLAIIGWALCGALLLIAVIVIALAAVKVKAVGLGGTSFEVDADDPPPNCPADHGSRETRINIEHREGS